MTISGVTNSYNTYTNSYTNMEKHSVDKTEKVETETTRKTAAGELAYLTDRFEDYSFVSANYNQGMKYGTSSTTNVAISPQFLTKMAADPKLEAEYIEGIGSIKGLDEQFARGQEARGWRVVARGWAIDKDGGVSCWSITTRDTKAKSFLQKLSEKADEIRQKQSKDEKKTHNDEVTKKKDIDWRV